MAATAAAYNPSLHEAPLVIGHPAHDAPAYGWVHSLEFRAGALWATVDNVDSAFEGIIKSGKFKKISVSFYPPQDKSNPKPGVFYLRHVGFLGAAAPAVKGLKPVQFSDEGCALIFGEEADDPRLSLLEQREQDLRRRETENLFDRLMKEGRLLPFQREPLLAFCEALSDNITLTFSEAGGAVTKTMRQIFLDHLCSYPPAIIFSEVAGSMFVAGENSPPNLPKGHQVDAAGLDLHRRAIEYQRTHKVDYQTAVLAVSTETMTNARR